MSGDWDPALRKPLRHERVPKSGIFVGGKPAFVLRRDAERVTDTSASQNISSAAALMTELVGSAYGPRGLYKLIVADRQRIVLVTKGARLLFLKLQLEHPAAQLLAGAGVSVAREVGGGALSTIVLASEIARRAGDLVTQGINRWALVDACLDALDLVSPTLNELAVARSPHDLATLRAIAKTSLAGGLVQHEGDGFASLAVEVVQQLGLWDAAKLPWLDYVDYKKISGGALAESELVTGLAFFHEPTHPRMPQRIEHPRIALIRGELRIPEKGQTRHYEHKFQLDQPGQLSTFHGQKITWFRELVDRFQAAGANTLLVERGIDPYMAELLANAGILAIRRFAPHEFDRFAPALGARIISDLGDLEPGDLGTAEVIEYRRVAGEEWWFLRGCHDPRAADILLRGFAPQLMDEAERSLRATLGTLRAFVQQPAIVPGGGAVEAELARHLRYQALQLADARQVALGVVADACETIPMTLARSADLDPLDSLAELRRQHAAGGRNAGVEVVHRHIADMLQHDVLEPLRAKQQVLRTALEVAVTLLRVDECIVAGRLSEAERKYVERMEGTKPERMRQIDREHGLER